MTLNDYQQGAARTRSPYTHAGKGVLPGLAYTTMGLASEVGEVANHAKKVYRDDGGKLTAERRAAMVDELGDVLWYVAQCAEDLETDLETIARHNLEKLRQRYDGRTE